MRRLSSRYPTHTTAMIAVGGSPARGAMSASEQLWPTTSEATLLRDVPNNCHQTRNDKRAMSLTWNMTFLRRVGSMASAAYLREQAELLTAMSRATMDLGMAGRLRAMASEFQTKATEQEGEQTRRT
jgi:hypothetical protein